MINALKIRLESVFNDLGLEARNIEKFEEFLSVLTHWNKKVNLVSKKEENIVDNLLAPSLLFFKLTEDLKYKTVVDLGSGAGFPSLVIKIYSPDTDIIMIEKDNKKCAFLNYVCAKLNYQVTIVKKNIFDMTDEEIEKSDIITVRGIRLREEIIDQIKLKTKPKRLIYFTSPNLHLSLNPEKEMTYNSISSQLYRL